MIAQITLMAVFIFRIPLGYIIGDKGMAYFGLANLNTMYYRPSKNLQAF